MNWKELIKKWWFWLIIVIIIIFIIIFVPNLICEMLGGRWHKWSFWQKSSACDLPYSDGDKICNDSSDCKSNLCLYTGNNPIIDSNASGQCAKWRSTSCVNNHYFIEKAKIVEHICVE